MAPDPIFAAIHARRVAYAAYMGAIEAGADDAVVDQLSLEECRATIIALQTTPTTMPGFLAFCDFGAEISREAMRCDKGGLGNWTPGGPLGWSYVPDAETMFFTILERAARVLRPMEA